MVTLYRSKTAAEKFIYTFDFTNSLPSSITVASGTATATKASDGTTDETILVSTTMGVPTSATATIQVTGGTSGETYRIKCTVVGSTAASWTKVIYLVLRVQDPFTS